MAPFDFYSLRWCESTAGHTFDASIYDEKKHFDTDNHKVNTVVHDSPYTFTVGSPASSKVVCNRILDEAQ
jgi:hypothetical protein